MKISLNWLQDYINLDLDVESIANYLTNTGLEVESIDRVENIKGGLKGILIGEVKSCEKHPNADRLNKTMVDVGKKELLNIVCGAPNVKKGQKVAVATVGSVVYDGDNPFKIKKSKIRGESSEGMICSEYEIGLGGDHDGILVLDGDAKVGEKAADYFNLEDDVVFDIGLTPNRSDAISHIGVARDLKSVLNYQGSKIEMCLSNVDLFTVDNNDLNINVKVEDSDLCPRYSGVSITGVVVEKSPSWLENRLKAIGIVPTNNIVDITNYVLHETGQPLHAFDASKIKGDTIIVQTASKKSKFVTLDGVERNLSKDDLMICNKSESMCIAGISGGLESGISEKTTSIFLESAYFDPSSIRKTAKKHALSTEASFRFERGCDPNMTIYALKRAALLIKEICGGDISSEIIDVYPKKINEFDVNLSYENLDSLVGQKIPRDVVKSILFDLDIKVASSTKDGLSLKVPTFRVDVKREVDVIEEILRIYGFDNIEDSEKFNFSIPASKKISSESIKNKISDILSGNGFAEIMNNSITKSEYVSLIGSLDEKHNIMINNPLSKDLNAMRQSLLFSGLDSISYNINRKNIDLKMYEFGKTYYKVDGNYDEKEKLMLLVSGNIFSDNWNSVNKEVDFFFLKRKVELVLSRLGITEFDSVDISAYGGVLQGLMYKNKKENLAYFGKVDSYITKAFGIKQDVFYAEIDWENVFKLSQKVKVRYSEVSKFPAVRRDLSLLLDTDISFKELKKIAMDTERNILKSVSLFDVYEGGKVPEGKKSYAISFILEDKTKTLTDKHIDKVMNRLISSYEKILGAEVRTK